MALPPEKHVVQWVRLRAPQCLGRAGLGERSAERASREAHSLLIRQPARKGTRYSPGRMTTFPVRVSSCVLVALWGPVTQMAQ